MGSFQQDSDGLDLGEHAVAAGMVAVAVVGSMPAFTTTVSGIFHRIEGIIQSAIP
jgi:Flp pilus assembly pilin Flp